MAARVTPQSVRELIATELTDDVMLTNHIVTANTFIDEYLLTSGLSDAMLIQVELYLSAHFVALTEEKGGITRDKMGDADQSYANIYESGLASTRFGQTALTLDPTGTLTRLAQTTLKAEFRVV